MICIENFSIKLVHMLDELAAALAARLTLLDRSLRLLFCARFQQRESRKEGASTKLRFQAKHTVRYEGRHPALELDAGLIFTFENLQWAVEMLSYRHCSANC